MYLGVNSSFCNKICKTQMPQLCTRHIILVKASPILSSGYAFYIPVFLAIEKYSILLPTFNSIILSAREMGLLSHWIQSDLSDLKHESWEEWQSSSEQKRANGTDKENGPDSITEREALHLTLTNLKGSFVVIGVGTSISFVVFLVELVIGNRRATAIKVQRFQINSIQLDEISW